LKVTSFDASALAGALTLTLGATKTAVKMGGKSSTVTFGSNLTNADSVIGGAGTGDKVVATVTGLSATTGALTTTGVEKLVLTTSGANTLALAGVTGLKTLQVTDNKQTITGFDLATTIVMGVDADVSATSSEIDVTATDATGTDDTLKVQINAAIAPTTIIDATGIETLALTIGANATDSNELTTINLATFDGTAVTLASGALTAGAVITPGAVALGNLKSSIVSLTSTNKAAVTANMSGAVLPVTFTGNGTGIQTITGGLKADTFNISSTAAVTHAITGGASTGDTTNITVTGAFDNAGSIDTENINITVAAAADPTITTSFGTGVDNVVILGGNELSTLTTGSIVDAVKKVDASGFGGNILATVANDKLDATVAITGGPLLTDKVSTQIVTAATYSPVTTAVEIIAVNSDEDVTLDLSGTTGVTRVEVDGINSKVFTVSNITDQAVRVTAAGGTGTIIEAKPIDASGLADAITFQIKDSGTAVTASFKMKTTDVETVTIKSTTTETVDLSELTMTSATKTVALNLQTDTTFAGITLSATSAQTTTINAAFAYGVTQTGRTATTGVNYTGSAGNDTFIMRSKADTIAAGKGIDTLDVNYASVLGGISVNLAAAAGVNQISTMDGGAITGSISDFENVDLSGYTGGGASVIARAKGSTITGTPVLDLITGGAAADIYNALTVTGDDDVVSLGGGNDTLKMNTAALADADQSGNNATYDLGGGTGDILETIDAAIIADADLDNMSNVEIIKLFAGTNSVTLGSNSIAAGILTVNGTGVGADTIVGSTAANFINPAGGADIITGGLGVDTIDLAEIIAATDDVILTDGFSIDSLSNFAKANDDILVDTSVVETANKVRLSTTIDIVEIHDNNSMSNAAVGVQVLTAAAVAVNAKNFFVIDLNIVKFATAALAVVAFEAGGGAALTFAGNLAQDDAFLFAYENTTGGTNIAIANFVAADNNAGVGNAAVTGVGNLEGTDLVTLVGMADATDLDATNVFFS